MKRKDQMGKGSGEASGKGDRHASGSGRGEAAYNEVHYPFSESDFRLVVESCKALRDRAKEHTDNALRSAIYAMLPGARAHLNLARMHAEMLDRRAKQVTDLVSGRYDLIIEGLRAQAGLPVHSGERPPQVVGSEVYADMLSVDASLANGAEEAVGYDHEVKCLIEETELRCSHLLNVTIGALRANNV